MVKISEVLQVPLEVLMIEEQTEDNRFAKSLKYSFVSYCIIFGLTLFIRGIRNGNEYSNILSRDLSDILKLYSLNSVKMLILLFYQLLLLVLFFIFIFFRKREMIELYFDAVYQERRYGRSDFDAETGEIK